MKKFTFLFTSIFILNWATGQELEVYETYEAFAESLIKDDSKIYVVNYWATWCAPCIKELPHFEELHAKYLDKNVEVVLVSLDFKNQRDKSLIPFLKKRNLKSRVVHMADPKFNDWIAKVDESWSGAIPATEFLFGEKELFKEKEYPTYSTLEKELEYFLKL